MNGFEEAMLPRLRTSGSEATRVVLGLHASGRSLADAVADTVESIPWKDTTELRRWTENWQGWLEWQRAHSSGWRIDNATSRRIIVNVPPGQGWHAIKSYVMKKQRRPRGTMLGNKVAITFDPPAPNFLRDVGAPSEEAVAAATDVGAVKFAHPVASAVLNTIPDIYKWLYFDVTRQR